jgi:hypothetical protein
MSFSYFDKIYSVIKEAANSLGTNSGTVRKPTITFPERLDIPIQACPLKKINEPTLPLTAKQLKCIMPNAKKEKIELYLPHLNKKMESAGIILTGLHAFCHKLRLNPIN